VKPAVAVYSAGEGNSYGHPHPEAIAALKAVGAKIFGMDVNGTVVVWTDGKTYTVTAAKGGPLTIILQALADRTPATLLAGMVIGV